MTSSSKTANVLRSTITGFISKIFLVVIQLISRKLFLNYIGLDYLSTAQVINSILAVFAFSELGLSGSVLYMLYKPVANNDQDKICRIISMYRKFNRYVGLIICGLGIIFIPFLNFFIKTNVPTSIVYVIYVVQLIVTVSTYFMTYRSLLLSANQKDYVVSLVDMIVNGLSIVIQCIIIYLTREYLFYLATTIIFNITRNFIIFVYVGRKYEFIKYCKNSTILLEEKNQLIKNVKSMFAVKLAGIVINNTDNLLVSWINTIMVGLTSNYSTITINVKLMLSMMQQALMHSIGIASIEKNNEEIFRLFKKVVLFNIFISGFLCVPLGVLWNDFIILWLGEKYVLDNLIVWSLLLNFCWSIIYSTTWLFRDSNGLFIYVKKFMIANTVLNLLISIILGNTIGISGVFFGTIISSMLTSFWYDTHILYKYLFFRNDSWKYNIKIIFYFVLIFLEVVLINKFTAFFDVNILNFIIKGCIAVIIFILSFVILNFKTQEFKDLSKDVLKLLNKFKR